MKKKLTLALACGVAASMSMTTTAFAESERSFKIGGNVELDITGDDGGNETNFDHGGRVLLEFAGTVKQDNGYFIKGVAQPLVLFNPGDQSVLIEQNTEQSVIDNSSVTVDSNSVEVDDLFFQFGREGAWDVKIGRFEAANLLPLGKDTLVVNAGEVQVYDGGNARGRVDDRLHAVLNLNLSSQIQLEFGVQANKSDDEENLAFRPVISDTTGKWKWHVGFETTEKETEGGDGIGIDTVTASLTEDTDGIAAGFGTTIAGGDFYVSVANLDGGDDVDVTTFAANYTRGNWGIGYIHSGVHDDDSSIPDPTVDTFYAAYTHSLFGFKDASITYAVSTSSADNTGLEEDSQSAARVRFNYTF